ncbi:peroxidase 5 [Panicum miliaceum]|uniref:Peroxidase n=1 Tax=Panicum miliaceum TaxID=4540 RepID=A0A3L6RYP7_PANMI|nr:peroxidase 5 [Panicum miliaceum]
MPRLTLLFLVALLALAARLGAVDASIVDGLEVGFYGQSCPDAEGAIRNVVNNEIGMNRGITPGLIRLFFHDCFITGCDASILLDESPAGDVPEKESSANGFTLVGLRTIDIAKSTVEAMCPRTVSCADILAFAARDAAVAAGLPSYDVAAGRRDGMRSNMDDLPGNFPVPGHHVPRLTELFNQRGLTQEDLVALSGAHSIGGAHCFMFSNRIYGFSKDADVDPSLDPDYAAQLRQVCPPKNPNNDPQQAPKVKFDARTGERLDTAYYSELLARRGLLTSDNALIEDTQTRAMVEAFARDEVMWQQKFAEAMQKVGMLDVLIGEDKGQVRRQCRLVNGQEKQQQPQQQQLLPWFRQRRPPRPFPHHPMGDLINGFFRGFH